MGFTTQVCSKYYIEANFTTVKKHFELDASGSTVDSFLEKFKTLRDQNKIKEVEKRNIDYWAKRSWEEFKSFVLELELYIKTKSESRKIAKQEGAKLVFEDSNWRIYQILSAYALHIYSKGTRWCINSITSYPLEQCFYILISKKIKKQENRTNYKIAVHFLDKKSKPEFWDASNTPFDPTMRRGLNLPEFKYKWFPHTT